MSFLKFRYKSLATKFGEELWKNLPRKFPNNISKPSQTLIFTHYKIYVTCTGVATTIPLRISLGVLGISIEALKLIKELHRKYF